MKKYIGFFFFSFVLTQSFCQTSKDKSSDGLLDSLSIALQNGKYSNVDAVVISQNGKVCYEKYFNGFTRDSLHDSRSSFKSITGLLIGIAVDKGYIKNIHQRAYSFFPEYQNYNNWDNRKDSITIQNLLEMKSGYNCEEWNGTIDCEAEMSSSNDWIKFCLDAPLKNDPGKVWAYSSINTMILGGIIANASKMTVTQFADKFLFKPLGIINYRWSKDPVGHEMTSGSFYTLPTDMIKIGELMLNKGSFQGKKVISEKWVNEAAQRITKIESFSNVRISKNTTAIPQPTYYGYTWYNEEIVTNKFKYNVVFASGNGGQYIMMVSELNLVISFTGNSYNSSRSKLPFDILIKYILAHFDNERHGC
jgi:CubicO group peptidase (beta-lactamase class C family)